MRIICFSRLCAHRARTNELRTLRVLGVSRHGKLSEYRNLWERSLHIALFGMRIVWPALSLARFSWLSYETKTYSFANGPNEVAVKSASTLTQRGCQCGVLRQEIRPRKVDFRIWEGKFLTK